MLARGKHKHSPEKGKGDANTTNNQIFPSGLQGIFRAVEINERRRAQGCRFNAHPEKTEIIAEEHCAHGDKKSYRGKEKEPDTAWLERAVLTLHFLTGEIDL